MKKTVILLILAIVLSVFSSTVYAVDDYDWTKWPEGFSGAIPNPPEWDDAHDESGEGKTAFPLSIEGADEVPEGIDTAIPFVVGDVVGQDNTVTASDALALLQYAVGKTGADEAFDNFSYLIDQPEYMFYADADSDGSITSTDALYALQIAVGKITTDTPEHLPWNDFKNAAFRGGTGNDGFEKVEIARLDAQEDFNNIQDGNFKFVAQAIEEHYADLDWQKNSLLIFNDINPSETVPRVAQVIKYKDDVIIRVIDSIVDCPAQNHVSAVSVPKEFIGDSTSIIVEKCW